MDTEREPRTTEPMLLRIHPDATRLTNLGRTTLYGEIAAGRLRAIRVGRSVRVRRDDLVNWIESHSNGVQSTSR
jgi:excisionase family DNA binding protein